jgi:hypothetical protein
MILARIVFVSLVCLAAAQDPSLLPVAPPSVQSFVQQALQDRLTAGDIPDLHLVQRTQPIRIRAEMPGAKFRLSDAAIPEISGFSLSLVTLSDAQAEADASNHDLMVVFVDSPQIAGNTASIQIGTDVVIHHQAQKVFKTCCCRAMAQFRLEHERWVFAKWMDMICS